MKLFDSLRNVKTRVALSRLAKKRANIREATRDPDGKGWALDPSDPNIIYVAGYDERFNNPWSHTLDELEDMYIALKQQLHADYPDFVPTQPMLVQVDICHSGRILADKQVRESLKSSGFAEVQYVKTAILLDGDTVEVRIVKPVVYEGCRFFVYDHPGGSDHIDCDVMTGTWYAPTRNSHVFTGG